MSSAAQTAANRANAQLSTGPRTLEGKARVSQNALRHGLTAETPRHPRRRARRVRRLSELPRSPISIRRAPSKPSPFTSFSTPPGRSPGSAASKPKSPPARSGLPRSAKPPPFSIASAAIRPARSAPTTGRSRSSARSRPTAPSAPSNLRKLQPPSSRPLADIRELTKQTQSDVTAKALQLAVKMVEYETGAIRLESLRNLPIPSAISGVPPAAEALPA